MFTQVRSANRRVSPVEDNKHKVVIKAVYVVLEPQYQNSLTEAAKSINKMNGPIGIDLSGYLIEELRNDSNFEDFKEDEEEKINEITENIVKQLPTLIDKKIDLFSSKVNQDLNGI